MLDFKKTDFALLLLRVVFGGLILVNHGWGKMMKLFTGNPTQFADPFGLERRFHSVLLPLRKSFAPSL